MIVCDTEGNQGLSRRKASKLLSGSPTLTSHLVDKERRHLIFTTPYEDAEVEVYVGFIKSVRKDYQRIVFSL